jgi:uncharacterized protein involved in outer membrane biogenesis
VKLLGPPARGWLRDARLWIIVAVVAYTLFGFFGVPPILRAQVPRLTRTYLGREASLAGASFNPFTLRTVLRGFDLRDRDGTPLAAFDELSVNLQASGLFRRAWTFREIRVVRPGVVGRILPDGRLAAADLLERKAEPVEPTEEFRLPRVLIARFEIESGKIEFQDESRTPPFATTLEPLTLRVSDLSTIPDRSGKHAITIGIEGGAEIRWSGRLTVDPLRLDGTLEVARLQLPRWWDYLGRDFPLDVASGEASVTVPYSLEKLAGAPLRADVHDLTLDVTGLAVLPQDAQDDGFRLERIEVKGGRVRWPEKTAEVDLVRVSEPALRVLRSEDGTLGWMSLLDSLPAAGAGEDSGGGVAAGWKASCAALEIAGGSVEVEDRSVAPPVSLAVDALEARFEHITSDSSAPVAARLSATVNGSGALSAGGSLGLKPLAADLDVELSGLELPAFQSYVSSFARVQLQSGVAGVRGKVSYQGGGEPLAKFEGQAAVDRLSLAGPDGNRVLAWDGLSVENVSFVRKGADPFLRVRAVKVVKPFAEVLIDRQGQIGVMKLLDKEPSGTAEPAATAEPTAPAAAFASPIPFEIGSISMSDGTVDYADQSLILPFATKIHSAVGSVTDISSKGASGSRLSFEGKVDEYGFAKAEGTLRLFDPYAASEVRVLFRNIEMDRLTPYTAEFAGYSIQQGRLDLEVTYEIHDRVLVGNHKLTATELTLGEKVEGGSASLPLRMAVALLKDAQGKIELDVPIEGSVDDPEFAYRKVIWAAFRRIMVNLTTAPFRFLGRLMGIEGDDLEFVSFEAGRGALLPPEQEKLGKLVEGLRSRPELVLQVGGCFDPVSDADAMRDAKLEALIAERRATMGESAGEDGSSVLDQIMEALYAETFSVEARETLRQKHTTTVPVPAAGEPAPPQPAFDAAGYFDEIRAALLEAQTVGADDLSALGSARAEAIVTALTSEGGIEPARVSTTDVTEVKKKEAGEKLVACQLAVPLD